MTSSTIVTIEIPAPRSEGSAPATAHVEPTADHSRTDRVTRPVEPRRCAARFEPADPVFSARRTSAPGWFW
jgi:hypothetical protein